MATRPATVALALFLVAVASACGSHHAAKLGFRDCVNAWNAPVNARRERVPAAYSRAGVQLDDTLGVSLDGHQTPNPVACRVILFWGDQWIAFDADRKGDRFRFRPPMLGAEEGDESGMWPSGRVSAARNARILRGTKLALGTTLVRIAHSPNRAEAKRLIDDWFMDGRIDHPYSCAVARAAVGMLPVDGPEVGGDIRAYERNVC